jgi:hypothetical protein
MAINITITGLTTQQQLDVANAFDQTIEGRGSLTKAQWVERQMLLYIKAVVKGWKRQAHESTLATEQTQVDTDYQ